MTAGHCNCDSLASFVVVLWSLWHEAVCTPPLRERVLDKCRGLHMPSKPLVPTPLFSTLLYQFPIPYGTSSSEWFPIHCQVPEALISSRLPRLVAHEKERHPKRGNGEIPTVSASSFKVLSLYRVVYLVLRIIL